MPGYQRYILRLVLILALIGLSYDSGLEAGNAISYNKEGWEYLNKGDSYKAIFSFKNSLKNNPNYKEAILGLAKAYQGIEVYDQAYILYNEALKKDKNSVEAVTGLGFTLTGLGRYSEAIEAFEKAEKLSEENLEAQYGMAYIYSMMGKKIWAKRKADSILSQNPYHYETLLLLADLKSSDNRLGEARKIVEKAIDAKSDNPLGYIKMAEILFRDYLITENEDSYNEAEYFVKNALSIQPGNFMANRLMGGMLLYKKNYSGAVSYLEKANSDTSAMLYDLAISSDMADDPDKANEYFLKAYKKYPSDSVLRSRLEDFLVSREYKVGNPARVLLSREHYNLALDREKRHYSDEVIMYLRRSLLLNPMFREPREHLLEYYKTLEYNNLYIDELKEILRLYPSQVNQERLNIAIIKRRDQLYHLEGYSSEMPPRDVPKVLVLNFESEGKITPHFDAGKVLASNLTYTLGQFGRMEVVNIRKRNALVENYKTLDGHLENTLTAIGESSKDDEEKQQPDFIIYGTYDENGGRLTVNYNLLDFQRGLIIGQFSLSDTEKEAVPKLSIRAAKRIFSMMPFRGRVLKLRDDGIIVNVGLIDGVRPGDKFFATRINVRDRKAVINKKTYFTVKESNTMISLLAPQNPKELEGLDSSDVVIPLMKKRAKKIQ